MNGGIITVLLILFLLVPISTSFSVTDHSGWPRSFGADNCLYVSPAYSDMDGDSSNGSEIVIIKTAGGHGCDTVYFYSYYEDGEAVSGSSISGLVFSNPAIGDLDKNASNGLETVFAVNNNLFAYYANRSLFWGPKSLASTGFTPAISDINGDGSLDIVIGVGSSINLYNSSGDLIWSVSAGGTIDSSPAIGDIDSDGSLEIVAGNRKGEIYTFESDGSTVPGWPQTAGTDIHNSAPALGDIDNDGELEIVSGASHASGAKVVAYEADGSQIFSKKISTGADIESSVALGDMDGDGDLEMIIGDNTDTYIHALHHDGSYVSGWPIRLPATIATLKSGPIVADVDGDSELEVIVQLSANPARLFIADSAGSLLYNKTLSGDSQSTSPFVGKSKNGKAVIGAVTRDSTTSGFAYLLDTQENFNAAFAPWPMYHRDEKNTGMLSPVAKITSPSSGIYNKGSTISFMGSGLSIDGDLTYSWTSNGTVIGSAATFTKSDLEPGTHIIKLTVTDPNGRIDESAPITLDIINLPTTVNITLPTDGQIFETGENITFSGRATDPDGSISSITWKANSTLIYSNSSVNQQTINISFDYDQLESGSYIISFSATDIDGVVTTDQRTIVLNSPPTATIITPSKKSKFTRGSTVAFVGSGSDTDGTIVSYQWTADGDYLSDSKSFTKSFSTVGTKTITLAVTDDEGATTSTSIDIIIKSPPISTTVEYVPPINESLPPLFAKKGFLSEAELTDMIENLGHMYGKKFVFDIPASPLASTYASKGEVVIGEKQIDRIWSLLPGFEANLYKMSGVNIYSAAALYALEHYTDFTNMIIVRGDLKVDSLAAAPLAKLLEAPILLVRPNEIPSEDLKVLEKMNGKGRIYIIGGSEAISVEVEEELKKYAGTVVRVGGATRYETSLEIAREMSLLIETDSAVSVNGRDPDLYAATLGAKYNVPVIYLDTPFSTIGSSVESLDIHQKMVVEFISEEFDTVGELYYRPS